MKANVKFLLTLFFLVPVHTNKDRRIPCPVRLKLKQAQKPRFFPTPVEDHEIEGIITSTVKSGSSSIRTQCSGPPPPSKKVVHFENSRSHSRDCRRLTHESGRAVNNRKTTIHHEEEERRDANTDDNSALSSPLEVTDSPICTLPPTALRPSIQESPDQSICSTERPHLSTSRSFLDSNEPTECIPINGVPVGSIPVENGDIEKFNACSDNPIANSKGKKEHSPDQKVEEPQKHKRQLTNKIKRFLSKLSCFGTHN
ncbi:hypothetical protein HYFRA_00012760 [Hymenoscyphus fraxineus]|uniref:Uncharacterized protein n=1 Tax=Hymenoscyphus fraxineus TaxID=746836 RepID=A0A9N9L825_9HELO|nr:hypothetical protein HYFRA_00012760 [Hymenoscyphus fraxineus]